MSHESSLDANCRLPVRGDRRVASPPGPFHLPQDMEQAVQVENPQRDREPVHLLLLRPSDDPHPIFPR